MPFENNLKNNTLKNLRKRLPKFQYVSLQQKNIISNIKIFFCYWTVNSFSSIQNIDIDIRYTCYLVYLCIQVYDMHPVKGRVSSLKLMLIYSRATLCLSQCSILQNQPVEAGMSARQFSHCTLESLRLCILLLVVQLAYLKTNWFMHKTSLGDSGGLL